MDTLELCGDVLQPGGQLETPGLVTLRVEVGYSVTSCKSMEEWQAEGFLQAYAFNHLMDCKILEFFACAKCYPEFLKVNLLGHCHCEHNNFGINSSYEEFCVPICHPITHMDKDSSVSFLVIAGG